VGVTSTLYAEIVREVGGDVVDVHLLSSDDPAAADACDLIVCNGLGWDAWVQQLDTQQPIFTVTDGLPLLKTGEMFHQELPLPHTDIASLPSCCQEDAQQDNQNWTDMIRLLQAADADLATPHTSDRPDPYVWLDPHNVQSITLTINELLVEYDPEHADTYDRNTDAYLETLKALDQWIVAEVAEIPMRNRILVTAQDHFRYFGRRYGFIMPIHFPSVLESAALLERTETLAQTLDIRALFFEVKPAAVFFEFNRQLHLPQPTELILHLPPTSLNYVQMMRLNVRQVVAALRRPWR